MVIDFFSFFLVLLGLIPQISTRLTGLRSRKLPVMGILV